MSRTDAHTPIWVRALDPLEPTQDHHDHRKGPCDLDTSTEAAKALQSTPWPKHRNRCYRDVDWGRIGGVCSCHMCNPRVLHGRYRVLWRKQRQELLKLTWREDYDVLPYVDKGW